MSAASFCTVTASTKRNTTSGGRTGAATTYLSSLLITPLWPLNQEITRALGIDSPREFKVAYHVPTGATLPDVMEADILVVDGVEMPIYYVGEWTDSDIPALEIVVQQLKQAS